MEKSKRSSICLKLSVSKNEDEINEMMDKLVESVQEMRQCLLRELMVKEEEIGNKSFSKIQDLETLRKHKVQTEDLFRENRQQEILQENMYMIDQKIQNIRDNLNKCEIKVTWKLEEFHKALKGIATLSTNENNEDNPPVVPPRRNVPRARSKTDDSVFDSSSRTPPKLPDRNTIRAGSHRVVRVTEETEDTAESGENYMQMSSSISSVSSIDSPSNNPFLSTDLSAQTRFNTISVTSGRTRYDQLPNMDLEVPALPPKNPERRRSSHTVQRLQEEKILGMEIERFVPIFAVCNRGKENDELYKASRVDIDIRSADLYISDTYNHCVKVFNRNGVFKFQFGSKKSQGKLVYPFGLTICSNTVYVGEKMDGRIKAFKMDGTYIKEITGDGTNSKKGGFKFLWGITADSENGDIYACDNERDRIQVYTANLEFKYTIIGPDLPGNVTQPVDVKVRDQMIIVLDRNDPCVHYFDKQGVKLWSMVNFSEAKVDMAPQSFIFDLEDNILITDAHTHTIRIFTPKGQLYIALGKKGENKGEFLCPTGIALDTFGNIVSICQRDKANLQIITYSKVET